MRKIKYKDTFYSCAVLNAPFCKDKVVMLCNDMYAFLLEKGDSLEDLPIQTRVVTRETHASGGLTGWVNKRRGNYAFSGVFFDGVEIPARITPIHTETEKGKAR